MKREKKGKSDGFFEEEWVSEMVEEREREKDEKDRRQRKRFSGLRSSGEWSATGYWESFAFAEREKKCNITIILFY